jgi:hypothetical protein
VSDGQNEDVEQEMENLEEQTDNDFSEYAKAQVQLANFVSQVAPITKSCALRQVDENVNGRNLYVFKGKCTSRPNQPIRMSITDTVENWANTIEHCGNVKTGEEQNGNLITRHYAVWATANTDFAAFSRPPTSGESAVPRAEGVKIYDLDEFTMPA